MKILPKKMIAVTSHNYAELPVIQVITHPRNSHPSNCPLIANCVAMEIRLEGGYVRWIGCKDAKIGSDLRMHFEPISDNDEVINRYEDDGGRL